MSAHSDIISFDLREGSGTVIDVARMFPYSEVHAIRSTKPILDTLARGQGRVYDFSLSRQLILKRFRTLVTLDLSTPSLWRPGLVTSKLLGIEPRYHTIDLMPPLTPPYGALDLRADAPQYHARERYADIYRRHLPLSLHIRREWRNTRQYLSRKRRSIALTTCVLVSLTIPILGYTRFLIDDGYAALAQIRDNPDHPSIIRAVERARGDFERANLLFAPFRAISHPRIQLATIAIDGGLSLTRGMSTLLDALPITHGATATGMITPTSTETVLPTYRGSARDISLLNPLGIQTPTDWLIEHDEDINTLQRSLMDAGDAYSRASSIDDPRGGTLTHVGQTLIQISQILDFYQKNKKPLLRMLGHDEPQRYLVFNQNRDEIRANGGFPGSVITFTVYQGNIIDYRTDDVYYYDWNLYPYQEPPPPGLSLLTGNYGLRDVNYYPDFRETLEKANTFIERSGDATITTGIALHQGLVEDILSQVGPVTLSGITEPFTAKNFSPLMSTLVESRHGEVYTPKDTLFRFIEALASQIHQKRAYDVVLGTLFSALQDGEILFASRENDIDTFLKTYRQELPWESTDTQWLYPVLTSISGNKSDRFMKRLYTVDTERLSSCRYEHTVQFTHTHAFSQEDEKSINRSLDMLHITDAKSREKMLFIQGKGQNRIYMRLYVPKGSILTGSTLGIQELDDPHATVFTWMMETPVRGSTAKTFRYITDVPNCQNDSGVPHWYRQPGLMHTDMR